MHPRHGNMCRISTLRNVDAVVAVSLFGKFVVAVPSVGAHLRVRLNRSADKRNQTGAGDIFDAIHAYAAIPLWR